MFRFLVFLVGSAVLAAIMAAVYYSPDNLELRETSGAFNPGPGEVRIDGVPPSVEGSSIYYEVVVVSGQIDIYVMNDAWAEQLAQAGQFRLDRPFSYYADWSATHVNGTHAFTIVSDGVTPYVVVFDNSDNFYKGDAGENTTITSAQLQVTARYLEEEDRSLTFGYLASIPSILLVVVTFGRSYLRWRRDKRPSDPGAGP